MSYVSVLCVIIAALGQDSCLLSFACSSEHVPVTKRVMLLLTNRWGVSLLYFLNLNLCETLFPFLTV